MPKPVRTLYVVVLIAALFLGEPRGREAAAQEPERPNVLIIVTDDQREGLRVMPAVRRRFVEGGTLYRNAYSTTPQCCPARASILTGRYVHNHAVKNNATGRQLDPSTTLSSFLQSAGYHTGLFGKYVNRWGGRPPPHFDEWVTLLGQHRYTNATYNVNGDYRDLAGYSTSVLGEKAVRFLYESEARSDEQPWMMLLTPAAPHAPYFPERRYEGARVGRWKGNPALDEYLTPQGETDKPSFLRAANRRPAWLVRRKQLRTLMSVDDVVSRLFQTIGRLDERNTIAIFTSDNGIMWGEHGWVDKAVPHTYSVQVPLLTRWPGHVAAGAVDDRIAANVDVTPTVLAAAGISPEEASLDGRSLLDSSWTRESILLEFFGPEDTGAVPPWASLRSSAYQYVEYYDAEGAISFREYYDLVNDPWQLNNLYGDADPTNDPADGVELQQRLEAARRCAESSCP